MYKKGFKVILRVLTLLILYSLFLTLSSPIITACTSDSDCSIDMWCNSTKNCQLASDCIGGTTGNCAGSTVSGNQGFNTSHIGIFSYYFITAEIPRFAFDIENELSKMDYISNFGIRYNSTYSEGRTYYNCEAEGDGCYSIEGYGELIQRLDSYDDGKLCAIEGDYYASTYTDESPSKIIPRINVYTINAQEDEMSCNCIKNAINPEDGLLFTTSGYIATTDGFKTYNWSDATTTASFKTSTGQDITTGGFGCCGPKTNFNITSGLDQVGAGDSTSCAYSSDASGLKYLCDGKTGAHPNEWQIASSQNLGCAYNTSCGYWILSNGTSDNDARFLKCSGTENPNKINLASALLNPNLVNVELQHSSFACLNSNKTSATKDVYGLYECVPISSPNKKCINDDAIRLIADQIRSPVTGSNNISNTAYVNITRDSGATIVPVYCLSNGSFSEDLDRQNPVAKGDNNVSKITCEKDGFIWTGSKCCGDFEPQFNQNEFYNDNAINYLDSTVWNPRTSAGQSTYRAGCWYGRPVFSGETLQSTKQYSSILPAEYLYNTSSVINYNGTFYGCNLSSTSPLLIGVNSSYETSGGKPSPLIKTFLSNKPAGKFIDGATNIQTCEILVNASRGNSFFCASNNSWLKAEQGIASMSSTNIRPDLNKTNFPASPYAQSECCPTSRCWNGTVCVNSSEQNSKMDVSGNKEVQGSYVCVEEGVSAHWLPFTGFKHTWDYSDSGICPTNTQCLVAKDGDVSTTNPADYDENNADQSNPKCINSGDYIKDHYCNKGNWTSRTKLVAEQLLKGTTGLSLADYSLFCDESQYALNKRGYNPGSNTDTASNYLDDNMNNICVLNLGSQNLVFGVSLNVPINESGIPEILGLPNTNKNYCVSNNNILSGGFVQCSAASQSNIWNVYYNKTSKLAIFTSLASNKFAPATITQSDSFETTQGTKEIVQTLQTYLLDTYGFNSNFISAINSTHDFNRIYVAKSGSKKVVAFNEKNYNLQGTSDSNKQYLAARYDNFNSFNVCNYVNAVVYGDQINEENINSKDYCFKKQNAYYISAARDLTGAAGNNLMDAWLDLTAKTRMD